MRGPEENPETPKTQRRFALPAGLALPIACYALVAALVIPVYGHFVSPSEFGRWAVAASLVEDRSLDVSRQARLLGPRFEDVAVVEGRTYSDKAPGLALVTLPAYIAARPFVGEPSPDAMRPTLYAMRWLGATIPALFLALTLAVAGRTLGLDERGSRLAVVVLLFGTPAFAYGLLLFAHVLVGACLFGAFAALFAREEATTTRGREILAGFLIGLAVLSEYPAAMPGAVLLLAVSVHRGARTFLRVAAGGAPFAAALGTYNTVCFGRPWHFSYAYEKLAGYRELGQSGAWGVGLPSPRILFELLFGATKGLFVFSPVLLLAILGAWRASRTLPRSAFAALVATPLSVVLFYGGYPLWHGGFTVGPRYLVSALPFLALLVAFAGRERSGAVLLGASAFAVALTSLVFPFVPPGFPLPWGSLAAPLLMRGLFVPSLLDPLGRGVAIAVILGLVAAPVLATTRRRWPLALLGASLALGAGLVGRRVADRDPGLVAIRAYVEDVYFERPGALERTLGTAGRIPPGLEARRRFERTLPPPPWPF